jgi:hypothetical protein
VGRDRLAGCQADVCNKPLVSADQCAGDEFRPLDETILYHDTALIHQNRQKENKIPALPVMSAWPDNILPQLPL